MRRIQRLVALGGLLFSASCGSSSESNSPSDDVASATDLKKKDASSPATEATPTPVSDSTGQTDGGQVDAAASPTKKIETVFVIVMENHSWSSVKDAPYIKSLLPLGAHAEKYSSPKGNHPSELNYVWMEAGDSLGITNDDPPSKNHQATKDHLSSQLEASGISWKAYAEDISGKDCPLAATNLFAPKHTPQLFFDDVTDTNSAASTHCKDHIRPYSELATDLAKNKIARYNFITPNLCHDMHGDLKCGLGNLNQVKMGDDWLKANVPVILNSEAFKNKGALFITWDEGDEPTLGIGEASDGPVGFIALAANAKKGHASTVEYTHSSLLRTLEDIYGVPYLRGAKTAKSLDDLFSAYP